MGGETLLVEPLAGAGYGIETLTISGSRVVKGPTEALRKFFIELRKPWQAILAINYKVLMTGRSRSCGKTQVLLGNSRQEMVLRDLQTHLHKFLEGLPVFHLCVPSQWHCPSM